jgi:hypothetical protein
MALAQLKQDFPLAHPRITLFPSAPDLLDELAGASVGGESLVWLAQQDLDIGIIDQHVSLAPAVPEVFEELAARL